MSNILKICSYFLFGITAALSSALIMQMLIILSEIITPTLSTYAWLFINVSLEETAKGIFIFHATRKIPKLSKFAALLVGVGFFFTELTFLYFQFSISQQISIHLAFVLLVHVGTSLLLWYAFLTSKLKTFFLIVIAIVLHFMYNFSVTNQYNLLLLFTAFSLLFLLAYFIYLKPTQKLAR